MEWRGIAKMIKNHRKHGNKGKQGNHGKNGKPRNNGNNENNGKYLQFASVPQLIQGYGEWVQGLFDDGFRMYVVTFKFNHIQGSSENKRRVMLKEVEYQFYPTLIKHVERQPMKPSRQCNLPRLMAAPDLPVAKHSKKLSVKDVTINDGLHVHAMIAMASTMRHYRGCKLKNLLRDRRHRFIGSFTNICHIDVRRNKKTSRIRCRLRAETRQTKRRDYGRDPYSSKIAAAIAELRANAAEFRNTMEAMIENRLAQIRELADGPRGGPGPPGPPGKIERVSGYVVDAVHYRGDIVTHRGSTYQARCDTAREPPHEDWICVAYAGVDGKDGRDGRSLELRSLFEQFHTEAR
jgi:hypothetical protein